MLLIEFEVEGTPLSHQTRNRIRLRAWQAKVRAEATRHWPRGRLPSAAQVSMTVIYFHDGPTVRMDNDNMVKPIQDALNGLVYRDDRQIVETQVQKRDINGSFKVRYIPEMMARGFIRSAEFVYIRITEGLDDVELLR